MTHNAHHGLEAAVIASSKVIAWVAAQAKENNLPPHELQAHIASLIESTAVSSTLPAEATAALLEALTDANTATRMYTVTLEYHDCGEDMTYSATYEADSYNDAVSQCRAACIEANGLGSIDPEALDVIDVVQGGICQ